MIPAALILTLLLPAPGEPPAEDANAPAERSRPRLGFKVFNDLDRPVTGDWSLGVGDWPPMVIEIQEKEAGRSNALVGIEKETGEEILELTSKKEGIGYEGSLHGVFDRCDLRTVPITEFVPLGSSIVLKLEVSPTSVPCPPVDSGAIGRFFAVSRGRGAVRLRDLTELSSSSVRETYSIGGERQTTVTRTIPLGGVTVEAGSELKFLRRIKAPLDGTYWFEMEAVLAEDAGVEPPHGFVPATALRFEGSLTLRRVEPDGGPGG